LASARFGFPVSEAVPLVESLLCCLVFPKALFGVLSPFSTALQIPRGFSNSRFETALDLSLLESLKTVLAKSQ